MYLTLQQLKLLQDHFLVKLKLTKNSEELASILMTLRHIRFKIKQRQIEDQK